MAEPEIRVVVNLDVDTASADPDIEKVIANSAERAARQITNILTAGARKTRGSVAPEFEKIAQIIRESVGGAQGLRRSLGAVAQSARAVEGSFGDAFDPANVRAFEQTLQRLVAVSAKLQEGGLNDEEFIEARQEIRALGTAVVATRDTLLAAGRASDEFARNVSRDARQASREQIEAARTARSQFVVEQQRQTSAARDASKRRVAIIQATARTIATIERGLSNIFRQTARVFSTAFRSAAQAVTGAFAGLGRAFQRTTTNITNTVRGGNRSITNSYRSSFRESTNTVRNETRQQSSIINNFARETTSQIGSIGAGVGLGVGAALAGGIAKALTGGFRRATTIENAERALTKLTGSAEEATTLLNEIDRVVTGTPFKFDQFAAGATQLLAFNVEASKIPEVLETVANASSLSLDSGQTAERLIRTFGQIQTAGKVTTEDLNQLAEAGVSGFDILGNALGVTIEDLRDLISEGAVPATEAIDILVDGINNGTDGINGATKAFGGLAQELGGTLQGSVTNLGTAFDRAGANVIEVFTPALVAGAQAARRAIDLIGAAFTSLAQAIVDSPLFGLLLTGVERLTVVLTEAKTTLKPVFDFIAEGIVALSTVLGGLGILRRIPGLFAAVGGAVASVLTPFNLLIAGGVLVAAFVKRLIEDSADLRQVLGEIAGLFRRVAIIVKDVAVEAFSALVGGAENVSEAISAIVTPLAQALVPILQRFAAFVEDKVIPAVRRLARFVRENVIPVLGRALTNAINFAVTAVEFLVDVFRTAVRFIRDEVVPVVGAGLSAALSIGESAFRTIYGFLSNTFVPFIQDNLVPALAGVGAALGVFAISGSPLIAGLAGIAAAAVAVLSNEDIRNALFENIRSAIDRAKELWNDFIDSGVLATIGLQVLKVARKIGETIGTFVSDPRFVAALGAIVASAVALAGSFVLGFLEGIESNLGDLVRGLISLLSKAFQLAITEAVKDPRIGFAIVGLIAGATVIRQLRSGAQRAGAVTAQSFGKAFVANANTAGVGNTTGAFFKALTGGPAAIERIGAQAGNIYAKSFARRINRNNDLIRAVRGTNFPNPLGLEQQRGNQGRFTNQLAATPKNLRATEAELRRLTQTYGTATIAGAQFRLGLRNIFRESGNVRQGLANIGAGLRTAAGNLGRSLGVIAGGIFTATFISQALFDAEATGQQKLQAGLGTIITGAITGAQVGGAKGAIAGGITGVAVTAFGLISNALKENDENARLAAEAFEEYAEALRDATSVEVPDILEDTFKIRLGNAPQEVREALAAINFDYKRFDDSVRNGTVVKDFGQIAFYAERTADQINSAQQAKPYPGFNNLLLDLAAVDVRGQDALDVVRFLNAEVIGIQDAIADQNINEQLFGEGNSFADAFGGASSNVQTLEGNIEEYSARLRIANETTEAFKTRLNELNEARLQSARDNLDEVTRRLETARDKAGEAKEALVDYLNGDYEVEGLQAITDEAALDVGRTARAQATADNTGLSQGEIEALARQRQGAFADRAAEVLAAAQTELGRPLTQEEADAALAPLIDAGSSAGGLAGLEAAIAIEDAAKKYFDQKGSALADLFSTRETTVGGIEASQGRAQKFLEDQLAIDPTTLQPLVDEAAEFAKGVGNEVAAGYVETIDGDQTAFTATKNWSQGIIDAALETLGIDSPSLQFEIIGIWTVLGFVKGIRNNLDLVERAGTAMKDALRKGLDPEGQGEFLSFLDAGRDAGYAFGDGSAKTPVQASLTARGEEMRDTVLLGISESGEHLLFLDAGQAAGYAFGDGTARAAVKGSLQSRGDEMRDQVLLGISESGQHILFYDAGRNAGLAFARGIRSSTAIAASAARAVANAAQSALENELEIDSPSKVFRELGEQTMEGFALGITDGAQLAADAADAAVSSALDTTVATIGGVTVGVTPSGTAATGSQGMTGSNIEALGKAIASASKPDVKIDQTFNESVDSRAVAADVAWRLT